MRASRLRQFLSARHCFNRPCNLLVIVIENLNRDHCSVSGRRQVVEAGARHARGTFPIAPAWSLNSGLAAAKRLSSANNTHQ